VSGQSVPPRRRLAALTVAMCLLAGVAGCSGEPPSAPNATDVGATAPAEPRPLTTDEAQRLAVMRFMNFDAGVRSVHFEVDDAGVRYAVEGWMDFAAGLGYATLRAEGDAALIVWTAETIGSHAPVGDEHEPPIPPPVDSVDDADWSTSALTPSASRLHAALAIALEAGHDRPDNPVLLQQTDARWLRSDEVDGDAVDVVAGPTSDHAYDPDAAVGDGSDATIRYWVDRDGVLRRLEARLGGAPDWTAIDFGDGGDVRFADAFTGTEDAG
jgi:hypothetical protein